MSEKKETASKKKIIKVSAVKTSKIHETFKASIFLGSTPTRLDIEATSLDKAKFIDLSRNPNKYTFGKIAFLNATEETFMYPSKNLDLIYRVLSQHQNAKSNIILLDIRRRKEIQAVTRRVAYYQSLSRERKKIYLRFHGFFANINIRENTNA